MSQEFCACDPVKAHDIFYRFQVVARYGVADSYESTDEFHTITHY